MINIIICGYRDWAHQLYMEVRSEFIKNIPNYHAVYVDDKDYLDEAIQEHKPEYVFFIGWSWLVDKDIIENYKCICLHPSPLPKYRGGSPLQHQIINGETESAITLFEMDGGIDTGDIIFQKEFSLLGELQDILNRISNMGSAAVIDIIQNGYTSVVKQDEKEATLYKRRKPKMSEIKLEDFKEKTAEELFNKIRALQHPYPNAFVVCKDGTKLFLTNSSMGDESENN